MLSCMLLACKILTVNQYKFTVGLEISLWTLPPCKTQQPSGEYVHLHRLGPGTRQISGTPTSLPLWPGLVQHLPCSRSLSCATCHERSTPYQPPLARGDPPACEVRAHPQALALCQTWREPTPENHCEAAIKWVSVSPHVSSPFAGVPSSCTNGGSQVSLLGGYQSQPAQSTPRKAIQISPTLPSKGICIFV